MSETACDWSRWCKATSPEALRAFYEDLKPRLTRIARGHGYAMAFHGSQRRDFDVVAIPWELDCSTHTVLADSIAREVCAFVHSPALIRKPHGRLAYLMPLGVAAVLDLSIMPAVDLLLPEAKP